MRKYLLFLLAAMFTPILHAQVVIKTPAEAEAAYMAGMIEATSNPAKALELLLAALSITPDNDELIDAIENIIWENQQDLDMEKSRSVILAIWKQNLQSRKLFDLARVFVRYGTEYPDDMREAMIDAIFAMSGSTSPEDLDHVTLLASILSYNFYVGFGDIGDVIVLAERYSEIDPKFEQAFAVRIAGRLRYIARQVSGDELAAVKNAQAKLYEHLRAAIVAEGIDLARLIALAMLVDDSEACAIAKEAKLPESPDDRYSLAGCIAYLGDAELATAILDTVADMEHAPGYLSSRILVALSVGDDELAQKYFERLAALPPAFDDHHYVYAMFSWYFLKREYDKVIEMLGSVEDPMRTALYIRAMLAKGSENSLLPVLMPHIMDATTVYGDDPFTVLLAEVALKESAYDTVNYICAIFEQSEEVMPGTFKHNDLAYALACNEYKLDLADKFSLLALKANPQAGAVLDTRAWVLYKQGRFEEALTVMEEALAAYRDEHVNENAVMLNHYGDILFALGRHEDACAVWRRVIPLYKILVFENLELDVDKFKEKLAAAESGAL